MSLGTSPGGHARAQFAYPGWVGDYLDLRALVRAVEGLATGALDSASAEVAASESERRASWDAEIPGVDRVSRTLEWDTLERHRREQLRDVYRVTMQVRQQPAGEEWEGEPQALLERVNSYKPDFIALGAGEEAGASPWQRRVDVILSPVVGASVSCAGPPLWIEHVRAVLAPVMQRSVPRYMSLRAPGAAGVFVLGSVALAWLVLGPWMNVREAGLRAILLGLLVGFNYYRLLNLVAPRFALTEVGRRPRALFALAVLGLSPLWVILLIEAVSKIL